MKISILFISLLIALSSAQTTTQAPKKEKWPVEINNNDARDLYHCLYIYFICSDHIGNWPNNKNSCMNYFKTCEDLITQQNLNATLSDGSDDVFDSGDNSIAQDPLNMEAPTNAANADTPTPTGQGSSSGSAGDTPSTGSGSTSTNSSSSSSSSSSELSSSDQVQVVPGDYDYEEPNDPNAPVPAGPFSCKQILAAGNDTSGVYNIVVGNELKPVYCDMVTSGGGWTVIQRRGDNGNNETYFFRKWRAYKDGFGDPELDVWAGLDTIHSLTSQPGETVQLMITMSDFDNNMTTLIVNNFTVSDEPSGYKISYLNYNNIIGNSLPPRETKFSTYDMDQDSWVNNCAVKFSGAWWYSACHNSNLNGLYLRGPHESFGDGMEWYNWRGYHYSVKTTELKVRAK